ncbi:MAG: type II toxin-antitoxin system VapC family toxin [Vulcanimicrobiaceae bacterium]
MSIVLDASTALAAILPDEESGFARAATARAVHEGLVVPALWPYEIQNALAMAFRRNRIDAESLSDALDALRGLDAQLEPPQGLGHELRLAQTHGLTAYDAAYLAVALNTGATLATNDQRLRHAAEKVGVALFVPPPSESSKSPRKRR